MAISRLVAPTDPPTADSDWTDLINWVKLALLSIELPFRMDWAGGLLKKGAIFYVSGTPYLNDTDVTPSGTSSNYVKLTPSGDGSVLTASYVANLTGVTWSTVYNGWYDGATPACLYIFDEHLAKAAGVITDIRASRDVDFYRHTRINLGLNNNSTNTSTIVIGNSCSATGDNAITLGSNRSTTRTDEVAINTIRSEVYYFYESENAVFDSLYALLGSNATTRIFSAIGSFGTAAITYVTISSSSLITIQLSSGSKTLTNGTETAIGANLKIMFLDGLY